VKEKNEFKLLIKINFLMTMIFLNTSIASELKSRLAPPRSNQCQLCHIKRVNREVFIPKKNSTKSEHFEIIISHGNLKKSCNDCHDVNNSNYLFAPATFQNTTPLCARCHNERVVEWQNGLHGKKIGSWDKNKNISYQCIDCHYSHSVSFKKMQANPGPK
jgi:predicted CXXCH cytochrome family protein